MAQKKRKTRKQKAVNSKGTHTPGKSKYARKVENRRRLARKLGLKDTPLPILQAIMNDED